ncbi:MAG: DNA gyrase modulator, partial [Acidilobaceae archaeon]
MIDFIELERIVGEAIRSGAEYAEVRYHRVDGLSLFFLNGVLFGAYQPLVSGVAIRVVYSGGLGFSSTSDLTSEGLRDALSRAIASARSSSFMVKNKVVMGAASLGYAKYSVLERKLLVDMPVEDKINSLVEKLKSIDFKRDPMRISSYTLSYNENIEYKMLVTSDGAVIESRVPRVSLFY